MSGMASALVESPMNAEKPKTLSVKLHYDVVEAARIVSAYRGESMTDMLSDLLRPVLATMEQEETAKRSQAVGNRTTGRSK
jgi:hypothetical protein